jgi:hypothetical protein
MPEKIVKVARKYFIFIFVYKKEVREMNIHGDMVISVGEK